MSDYICPICHNSDPLSIGEINGKKYCRLCLKFKGKKANQDFKINSNLKLTLEYPLSNKQERIASKTLEALKDKKNVLIYAITGSGKTELVYYSIYDYLKRGLKVGFATPRKDVVVDLLPRFKKAFKEARIASVYQDHTFKLEGDLILLTTHQLYRYPQYFDLLILDEIDAFPYKGNEVLESFFYKAVRGNYVLLSATPSKDDIRKIKKNGIVLKLFERYHKGELIVPIYKKTYPMIERYQCYKELKRLLNKNKQVFIFTPTIESGIELFNFLRILDGRGECVSSKAKRRSIDIEKFKRDELKYLVTTSILERGITVKDLQVIIYQADDSIFSSAALVQISGRVGRKIGATTGEVIYLASSMSKEMEKSIDDIKRFNREKDTM